MLTLDKSRYTLIVRVNGRFYKSYTATEWEEIKEIYETSWRCLEEFGGCDCEVQVDDITLSCRGFLLLMGG